jgi:peroxiredoxin
MERSSDNLNLALGETAPYFSLKGTDGKLYTLQEFAKKPVLVVVFTCNHCPYAQAYEGRLVTLAKRYESEGVQFVAICSNDPSGYPEDDYEHMVARSKEMGFPFPYLHDVTQIAAKSYDAQCTPECYVFDHERKLRYHGRIDDNYKDPEAVTSFDLRNALEAILAQTEPPAPLTPAIGCSIKWKR